MKNTTNYTKEQINEAIYTVMKKRFKKDAKEAHKIVEDAGYSVYKGGNGYFDIYNPETQRHLWVTEPRYSYRKGGDYQNIYSGPYTKHMNEFTDKFDFVGCLEKPINSIYYQDTNTKESARHKYDRIKHLRYMEESWKKDAEECKKKIDSLLDQMQRYTKYSAEKAAELSALRKEYGLQ